MRQKIGERAAWLVVALGKSVCYLVLLLGMQALVMMPLMLASSVLGGMGEAERAAELYEMMYGHAMLFSALSGLLTIAAVLLIYLIRRKKLGDALWLRRVEGPGLMSGVALAPALYLIITLVMSALPEEWLESYGEASSSIGTGGLIGVAATVLVAPVVEELIFRGLMMTRLSQAVPGWLAAVLSAAIFGVCHGHPVWFAYTFVIGLLFGLIDLRLGSIWPSILAHVAFNAIGELHSLLPETEEGTEILIFLGALAAAGILAPLICHRSIAALFRPRPEGAAAPACELPTAPETYDFDPWEE